MLLEDLGKYFNFWVIIYLPVDALNILTLLPASWDFSRTSLDFLVLGFLLLVNGTVDHSSSCGGTIFWISFEDMSVGKGVLSFVGEIICAQEVDLWPSFPQVLQRKWSASYWMLYLWVPMKICFFTGSSIGISMHNLAYRPLNEEDVQASILSSLPIAPPILFSISPS